MSEKLRESRARAKARARQNPQYRIRERILAYIAFLIRQGYTVTDPQGEPCKLRTRARAEGVDVNEQ